MARFNPLEQWKQARAERQRLAQESAQAQQMAQIPILDLRNSEWATLGGDPAQWPEADVLDMEQEAQYAGGVLDIPTDFATRTINPPRPRTISAGYDADAQVLRIKFRPGASVKSPGGAVYDYFDVSQKEWEAIQRAISTGRFINNQLTAKDYARRA